MKQQDSVHERLAGIQAYLIWEKKEGRRSCANWLDAISQLSAELGRFPTTEEINRRANALWKDRHDGQSLEDWLEAEQLLNRVISRIH